ncbi:MAG: hypothetical protein ACP6IY_09405 [Promethearchaeia archaeon]
MVKLKLKILKFGNVNNNSGYYVNIPHKIIEVIKLKKADSVVVNILINNINILEKKIQYITAIQEFSNVSKTKFISIPNSKINLLKLKKNDLINLQIIPVFKSDILIKYICNNCKHIFETNEEIIRCPKCNFEDSNLYFEGEKNE